MTIAGSDSGAGPASRPTSRPLPRSASTGRARITALTAQNTRGVLGVWGHNPEFVALQIDAIAGDIGADAVKTGMLANRGIIEVVGGGVRAPWGPLVVDPVMVAKGGDRCSAAGAGCADRAPPAARGGGHAQPARGGSAVRAAVTDLAGMRWAAQGHP